MNAEIQEHQSRARAVIEAMTEYPEDEHSGRGIVICAGGVKYFTCAWVCIRMVRHLGCLLPVEMWHLGPDEMTPEMADLVAPLDVTCVDALDVRKMHPARILNGWEVKPFAIIHSRFAEVLYLDADNVPVVNPEFLFQTPEYASTGAIFWPDYGRLDPARSIWAICEVPYRDEPEFESGEIVLDKRRSWQALQLAMHYNEYSDFYYKHMHGDKETFHMAWRRLGRPYAMPSRGIESLSGIMCQHDFQGRRIFQHRNSRKWTLTGPNPRTEGFLFEQECLSYLEDLRGRWRGSTGPSLAPSCCEKTPCPPNDGPGDSTATSRLSSRIAGTHGGRLVHVAGAEPLADPSPATDAATAKKGPLRTALIFVWFGAYPPIYHLTVRSACRSGITQILLYGDEPPCLYPNLRWVPQTLGDVTRRVRRVLPEAPEYSHPYKLCDLRPLYYFMFEEDIADADYWMWQDLDAMCGSFEIVRPFLNQRIQALSHHPHDLGGHWQLFASALFRGKADFWRSRYASAADRFQSPESSHRMDEVWLHEVLHQEGVQHLHAQSLEKMGAVYYLDGHLIKPGEGEFWTYHFLNRYRRPSYLSVPPETYESNRLAICDEDSTPFRIVTKAMGPQGGALLDEGR